MSVAAPHNFLKADPPLLEQISQREWMIARIVQTEEAVASGGEVSVFMLPSSELINRALLRTLLGWPMVFATGCIQ